MRYIISDQHLTTDSGRLLKKLNCPLEKQWKDLSHADEKFPDSDLRRYCGACSRHVININDFTQEQVEALVVLGPDVCVHATDESPYISFETGYSKTADPALDSAPKSVSDLAFDAIWGMPLEDEELVDRADNGLLNSKVAATKYSANVAAWGESPDDSIGEDPGIEWARHWVHAQPPCAIDLNASESTEPVVRTARTLNAINEGARSGFWPLVKEVLPCTDIKQKVILLQHEDGSVELDCDARNNYDRERTIIWFSPYWSPEPFAAYLIPRTIEPNTRVYVPDLIEHFISGSWNQGDKYRACGGYAIWTGNDLEIEPMEPRESLG